MFSYFFFAAIITRFTLCCLCLFIPTAIRASDPLYTVPASALTDEARRNLVGGFTYDLPPGWSLRTVPGTSYKVAFGREEDGSPGNISFQVAAFSGNLGEFEATLLKEMPSTFAKMGITNSKVVNLSAFETSSKVVGLQAVVQADRLDGKTVRQLFYFFERKDGQKICVTCSVADEGTRYDAIFDSIMKTFRVTK